MEQRRALGHHGAGQQTAKVQAFGFPVFDTFFHVQQIAAADQVVELDDTQLRHDVAHFFGDKEEVIHHVLGLAREFLTQHRVLCSDTHRAGIEVTFAHHDAAFDHQWRCRKTEFIRAQQCANGDIAAGLHLAVGLHTDASAQTI